MEEKSEYKVNAQSHIQIEKKSVSNIEYEKSENVSREWRSMWTGGCALSFPVL